MRNKVGRFIIVAVLINVPACSYVKNLFPDKEKDYQFTTEIPPLILPPDLVGDSKSPLPEAPVTQTADAAPAGQAANAVPAAAPPTETVPAIDRKLIQVELLNSAEGEKRLHIGVPLARAWHMVGKALIRKSIEVTNRNQEEGLFNVQFDPNKEEVVDGSLWDEAVFFFIGFTSTEQEYALKLVGSNQTTDVIIMDKDQKPVADKTSLSLLALLYDTIKADLAQ